MLREKLEKLAKDPRFISGIYNYCDRWCERCGFTKRCMNYALDADDSGKRETLDINNKEFWDKLHEIFSETLEMVKEDAKKMGIDLDSIDYEEAARLDEQIHKVIEEQPHIRAAMKYIEMTEAWFESNKKVLEEKAGELVTLVNADIPGARPDVEAVNIKDCIYVIRWYQHFIYVKLCRAASGMIRGEFEEIEYCPEDANGSAKVAIIGIERSIAGWGRLMKYFSSQEDSILKILAKLQSLLRQSEEAFPDARAFKRPGFDTEPDGKQ